MLAELGAGGLGRVLRAYDRVLERDVALKALSGVAPEDRYHLKREFRVLAGFDHPHVVKLYELFSEADDTFFTMELVDGLPLLEYLATHPEHERIERATALFAELAAALRELHRAGHFHRDVSPANVLVDSDGHATLIDLGLVTAEGHDPQGGRGEFVGTPAYMAPEQMWGVSNEATDAYSLGASWFEALTGRLPSTGAMAALTPSQLPPAERHPGRFVAGLDPDIDDLIADLLDPDPDARAPLGRVLDLLASRGIARIPARSIPTTPFVGRSDEREALERLLERSRMQPTVVQIEGPSGIGKTELARRFVRTAAARGALVLFGDCRRQESVPFRALDPLVDELSRYWKDLEDDAALRLVPHHRDALIRLFPVLARVPALTGVARPSGVDEVELLRRGASALAEVLGRIALERALIIWIDDVQWSDQDSIALLRRLLESAAAPRVLLLLSHRSEDRESAVIAGMRSQPLGPLIHEEQIVLAPLARDDALSLARSLVTASGAPLESVDEIVDESSGSPFLLNEWVRNLGTTSASTTGARDIAAALWRRFQALPPTARSIVEAVAVAGRPFPVSFVLDVSGGGRPARTEIFDLCRQAWLRWSGSEIADEIETYHDQIREALIEYLDLDRRRTIHLKIAEGVRALPRPDLGLLVEHYMAGGNDRLAADHAVEAGSEAAGALAFERAADYYALALRLRESHETDYELQTRLADALRNAGRATQSADAFLAAAAAMQRTKPDSVRALRLEGAAAEQYLYGGEWQRGLERTRHVARGLGIRMPRDSTAASRAANLHRLRYLLTPRPGRRLRSEGRDATRADRLDILFGIAKGSALLFPSVSDYLGMVYLREALRAGDPDHVAIAMAKEASLEGALPGEWWRRRGARLCARAREIAEQGRRPHVLATVLTCESALAYFRGAWSESADCGARAVEMFRNECVGESASVSISITFLLPALAQCGRLAEMRTLVPEFRDDARRRGDLTASRVLEAGDTALVGLADGDPVGVIESAERLRRLPSSREEAALPYHHALATWRASLYQRDPLAAWNRLADAWEALEASGLMFMDVFGTCFRVGRAATGLACIGHALPEGWDEQRLVRLAGAEVERLARNRLPHARPWADVLRAGVARVRGDRTGLTDSLQNARRGFEGLAMPLHAHACEVRGARSAKTSASQSEAWMAGEGIVDPDAMSFTMVPVD